MLEISQKMSSARTVDSAIVVENVIAGARFRMKSTVFLALDDTPLDPLNEEVDFPSLRASTPLVPGPARIGNSLCHASVATTIKVRMNGNAEKAVVGTNRGSERRT